MNLLKPLIRISSITALARTLGFIRDTIIAQIFGVSAMTDAFFIAFKLSNLLRRVFAEGAFYQIFLPILSEHRCCNNKKEIQMFIAYTFGLLIFVLIIIIIIGLVVAPWIIIISAPGFNSVSEKFYLTVLMFRIMFPYILLVSLTSLMGAILNVWNFFSAPAFTPIFLSISMIIYMLFSENLCFNPSIIGLAWSVIIGGILQCIYYLPFLKKIDLLVLPRINFFDSKIHRICKSMCFMLIALSSSQVSLIINTVLSSFLIDGSISWMFYADRIVELPIGVFGVTLMTVLLPSLSRVITQKNQMEYYNLMNWGVRLSLVLSLPSSIILGILSKPLVITLFQYGKFSEFDVLMTQYSVIAYSIGLPGLILVKILTAGFYSRHDTTTPIQMIIITVIFTQCINLVSIYFLKHVAFAFSVSLGSWLHASLLYLKLKKKYLFNLQGDWLYFFYQLFVAVFVMFIVLYLLLFLFGSNWIQLNFFGRFFKMIIILVGGISAYLTVLWYLGMRLKNFFIF